MRLFCVPFLVFWELRNVTTSNQPNCVHRGAVSVTSNGIVIKVTNSKTIQFKERYHEAVLPFIQGHPLCPTTHLITFMSVTSSCPDDAPLFAIPGHLNNKVITLTASAFRRRLSLLLSKYTSLSNCSTHSLRRGGATWLLTSGVPVASIKVIGDWKSDCV